MPDGQTIVDLKRQAKAFAQAHLPKVTILNQRTIRFGKGNLLKLSNKLIPCLKSFSKRG